MNGFRRLLEAGAHFLHRHFLWLLIGAYLLAGLVPWPGLWVCGLSLGNITLGPESAALSLPGAMLAWLLLNAGLGVEVGRLREMLHKPQLLAAGLAANLVLPLVFILGLSQTLRLWHNVDEVQNILVGLALVASMPVAGSSAAWSQHADGDLALSLGLVVFSTCLSPLTTPAVLNAIGWVAHGIHADALHQLAGGGTGLFLTLFVLLPTLAGMGVSAVVGAARVARVRSVLKLFTSVILMVLCYANACVALPRVLADPDWDFLGVMLAIVLALCVLGFVTGRMVGWCFQANEPRRTALMFGLGMNNNGTGLVLAGTALVHLPAVMLPVLFYNLAQHVVAGMANYLGSRPSEALVDPSKLAQPASPAKVRCP
jgi:BASS family bile acid:Na+ symporter